MTTNEDHPYTAKERENIWTAIDNLQTAFSIIRTVVAFSMPKEDLERLDDCIKTVFDML